MSVVTNNLRAVRGPITALPVVAGKGVRFVEDTENNRVVVEADETVLFEAPSGHGMNNQIVLSEDVDKFDRIRLYYNVWGGAATRVLEFTYSTDRQLCISNLEQFDANGLKIIVWRFDPLGSNNKNTLSMNFFAYYDGSFTGSTLNAANLLVYKVVGVDRKANV